MQSPERDLSEQELQHALKYAEAPGNLDNIITKALRYQAKRVRELETELDAITKATYHSLFSPETDY